MPEASVYRYISPAASPREDPKGFIEGARGFIREHVKPEDRVKIMVSGGVDSSVTAALFHLEIGDRLHVTHVDTGFMRLIKGREEPELVADMFAGFSNFKLVDGRSLFYERVMGIPEAEDKRLGFRKAYEIITDREMADSRCNVMTQGTILPDIIETDGRVKSQHNVHLRFEKVERLVEPIAGLCKDEVRKVAECLISTYGLTALENVIRRQPFPGPGLSIRAVGRVNPEKLSIEKRVNDLVESMIEEYTRKVYGIDLYIDPETGEQVPFQSFAAIFDSELRETPALVKRELERYGIMQSVLMDTRVTGVKDTGEIGKRRFERIYSRPICIRDNIEDYGTLREVGLSVPIKTNYSRVLYKITSGEEGSPYSTVIRSVRSVDAMSADIFEIPLEKLREIGEKILTVCNVTEVYFDVSGKPPATIEYE
ncbi:MAG: hypothetical protein GTN80_11925 [Nitrososphaeria archaeon]|nr:hypothetical protein [Nitrososphaeria archaeon]NIN53765.1 hypothetical protein [Nitrososphaeria archaeon]NIQ34325.1 hypothetical protein [Nitrososphaeria archaeon]